MQNYGYAAYPYGQGYGYPSYGQRFVPQTPQMAQPQPQPQAPMGQQMPLAEMPIQDIKFVNKAQAEAYIVYPNTKVMLIDKESGVVYVKTADAMGQSKTDYFRFEAVNADGAPVKPQETAPQINMDDFVRVEQLKEFGFVTIEQYNELYKKLEQMQKRLEVSRTNVGNPKQAPQ